MISFILGALRGITLIAETSANLKITALKNE